MHVEEFIEKQLRQTLIQGGVDLASINGAVEMCLKNIVNAVRLNQT